MMHVVAADEPADVGTFRQHVVRAADRGRSPRCIQRGTGFGVPRRVVRIHPARVAAEGEFADAVQLCHISAVFGDFGLVLILHCKHPHDAHSCGAGRDGDLAVRRELCQLFRVSCFHALVAEEDLALADQRVDTTLDIGIRLVCFRVQRFRKVNTDIYADVVLIRCNNVVQSAVIAVGSRQRRVGGQIQDAVLCRAVAGDRTVTQPAWETEVPVGTLIEAASALLVGVPLMAALTL